MDDLAAVVAFPPAPDRDAPFVESAHSRGYVISPTAEPPEGADVVFTLPDGSRFAYAPTAAGEGVTELTIDPFVRGNRFTPLHASDRAHAALLGLALQRRLETGPESERLFVILRGTGLLFLENGDTHRFEPNHVVLVPPGEPAALWAQGPEDLLAVVLQPRAGRAPRRTLAGEIGKRRAAEKS